MTILQSTADPNIFIRHDGYEAKLDAMLSTVDDRIMSPELFIIDGTIRSIAVQSETIHVECYRIAIFSFESRQEDSTSATFCCAPGSFYDFWAITPVYLRKYNY
jgi:hypothetical protein